MAEPVYIELDEPADAAELAYALGARGLSAVPITGRKGPELLLSYRYEDTGRLVADLTPILDAWLRHRRRERIALRIGARRKVVVGPENSLLEEDSARAILAA